VEQAARDEWHREMLIRLELRSYMVVPLVTRGRTLGAISFIMAESGRRYGEADLRLAEELLAAMQANGADFTLTFRRLCDAAAGPEGDAGVRALFADPAAYDACAAGWRRRLAEEPSDAAARSAAMRAVNPAFIPRNHLVEAALDAAVGRQDFGPFEDLLEVLSRPYEDRPGLERYTAPPAPEERVLQTFCGT
jgi:uncharacterized protein YdiU (UPF0061 family)